MICIMLQQLLQGISGGIKLGAGGLVRAYSKSVLEAIEASEIIEVEYYDVYNITFNYS